MKLKIIEARTQKEFEKLFEEFSERPDVSILYGSIKFQRNIFYDHDGVDFTKILKESWIAFIPYWEVES